MSQLAIQYTVQGALVWAAMLAFPISAFCRRFLGVGGQAWDALLGLVVLFPAGIFSGLHNYA